MGLPIAGTPYSAASTPTGNNLTPTTDFTGAFRVMEGGGKYADANRRGVTFTGSTAATGVNIPIYTSTTQQFVLYNPVGSGKVAKLRAAYLGYISGTPVIGHVCYVVQNIASSSSAAPTGTANNIVSGKTCNTTGSVMSLLTAATVVAGTYLRPWASVFTTTAGQPGVFYKDDFDGFNALQPGCWIAIAANAAAFGTHALAIEWQEENLTNENS